MQQITSKRACVIRSVRHCYNVRIDPSIKPCDSRRRMHQHQHARSSMRRENVAFCSIRKKLARYQRSIIERVSVLPRWNDRYDMIYTTCCYNLRTTYYLYIHSVLLVDHSLLVRTCHSITLLRACMLLLDRQLIVRTSTRYTPTACIYTAATIYAQCQSRTCTWRRTAGS